MMSVVLFCCALLVQLQRLTSMSRNTLHPPSPFYSPLLRLHHSILLSSACTHIDQLYLLTFTETSQPNPIATDYLHLSMPSPFPKGSQIHTNTNPSRYHHLPAALIEPPPQIHITTISTCK